MVKVVRKAFGRDLEFEDIYRHVTLPEEVCLLRQNGSIVAMRSHNRKNLSGLPSLILEGAAIDPSLHGNGIYGKLLSEIYKGEVVICLKTQNPRVYAGLEKFCAKVYPRMDEMPCAIREIQKSLALNFGCKIDENGVARGYYGGQLYGEEPFHERVSPFFKEKLKMDFYKGDGILVVGVK